MAQAERRSITRRTLVAAALVPAALPAPLCTVAADPLFVATDAQARGDADVAALLAAHRTAVAAFEAAARHLCDVEEGVADDGGQDRGSGDDDDPFLRAATAAFDAAWDAETRAAWALARAVPANIAAAATLLRYVGDVEAQDHDWPEPPDNAGARNWASAFHHTLTVVLDGMAAHAAT